MSNDEFEIFRSETDTENIGSSIRQDTSNNPQSSETVVLTFKPTVLIIDDDAIVRDALKLTFEKKYNIILCENGESGVENVNSNVFAVILDIKMEGQNGFDTFIEIKKINLYLPIVFLTAYQDIKSPFEIMNNYRPFGYVIKGAESKQLLDTIESAINYYMQISKNSFLVKALQSKNMVLTELRENLEAIVETRTVELTTTNKELQKEIEFRQSAEKEIKSLLLEKEIILKEVHHRIKNNMTTLQSLLSLQASTQKEPTAKIALNESVNHIQSMMILYDKLYQSANFEDISAKEYIPSLIEQILGNFPNHRSIKILTEIEDFILGTRELQPLGIIITELLSNIMKYAFKDVNKDRQISIELGTTKSTSAKQVFLIVADNGKGIEMSMSLENSKGFGFRLMHLLAKQLKGNLRFESSNGTKFILEFPFEN